MNHSLLGCELPGFSGSALSGSIHTWLQLLVMAGLIAWWGHRPGWPALPGRSTKEVYIVNITIVVGGEGGTDDPRIH